MSRIIFFLQQKFENSPPILLKLVAAPPLPTRYNGENQENLQVVSTLDGGGGVGTEVRQVKLYSRSCVCAKAPKLQICPKTSVHDCRLF